MVPCRAFALAISWAVFPCAIGGVAVRSNAQCALQWLPGGGVPGTDGPVYASAAWDPDGSGPLLAMLVVGGNFGRAGTAAASSVAMRDPVSGAWSALGSEVGGRVHALAPLPTGEIAVGGAFGTAGGAGATTLPWIGSTFRSEATGLAANGLAVGTLGVGTASTPLAALLPQGVAGCTLLVSPDVLDLHVPVAGAVNTQIDVPNAMALTSQVFHQQIVSVEIGVVGGILALTSTNALALTVGAF